MPASVTDSGNARAWLISVKNQAALRKKGCDERRRYGSSGRARASHSVAEIDDGRLLLLSTGETLRKTKREFVTPTKSGAQVAWAGANARRGKSGKAPRFGNETRNAIGDCGEQKTTRSLSSAVCKAANGREARELERPSVELVSGRAFRAFFHGSSKKTILVVLLITRQPTRERGAGSRREATKRETRRGTRPVGTNNSQG